jgi:hypothetical protein
LKEEIVTEESQHDLEHFGVAKNAREEKLRARAERNKLDNKLDNKRDEENLRMAKLYREFVLKEQAVPELVQIGLGAGVSPAETANKAVSSSGD